MSCRYRSPVLLVLFFVGLMLGPRFAAGQSFYGSLLSVVRDAQSAAVPGATITLTNTATNERREGVSAEDGTYRFLNLVPGRYRLEVQMPGFQRYVRDGIEVNVQTTPRIDVALELGSQQETVSVTAESPLLQTEVTGLEMFRKTVQVANAGDNVGLLLRGVEKNDLDKP